MNYYAVHTGHTPGIYNTWIECKTQTEGFANAKFHKFSQKSDAEYFLKYGKPSTLKPTRLTSFFTISKPSSTGYNLDDLIDDNVCNVKASKQEKQCKQEKHPLMVSDDNTIYVYTDGGCNNNGKKNARAGMGIYFGEGDPRNVSEEIEAYNGKKTNNIAELKAIIRVYDILKTDINNGVKVVIYSDSDYSIRCCTTYGRRLKSQGWKDGKKDIPNLGLVKEGFLLYNTLPNISFKHVMAHTGKQDRHSLGNENADKLASMSIGNISKDNNNVFSPHKHSKSQKIYLNVEYSQKEQAKAHGAKWDKGKKKWYIENNCPNKEMLIQMF